MGVPKCNSLWPAIWLLPEDEHGNGKYGRWPCSGEIDMLETVNTQNYGAFNIVSGYGSAGDHLCTQEYTCNKCLPNYCTSTTMDYTSPNPQDRYFVEDVNCNADHPSWEEHLFVLSWQPDEIITWVDPQLAYNSAGRLISIIPKPSDHGMPSYKAYYRATTPKWQATQGYFEKCFPDDAGQWAPF